MKKTLILGILLSLSTVALSQMVTLRYGSFDNGLQYPLIIFNSDKAIELSINNDLEKKVAQFKERDFCIGQSGFIQKTSFFQIHIYANCIDMAQSENYYYLYDLETGEECTVSTMLNFKVEGEFNTFFLKRLKTYIQEKGIELSDIDKEALNDLKVDHFTPFFETEGIQFTSKTLSNWGAKKMFISWSDLQTYLKISYI